MALSIVFKVQMHSDKMSVCVCVCVCVCVLFLGAAPPVVPTVKVRLLVTFWC